MAFNSDCYGLFHRSVNYFLWVELHRVLYLFLQDNQLGESELMDLAENYSRRFRVDSLGVYDALFKLWQHSTSEFVPAIKEVRHAHTSIVRSSQVNY